MNSHRESFNSLWRKKIHKLKSKNSHSKTLLRSWKGKGRNEGKKKDRKRKKEVRKEGNEGMREWGKEKGKRKEKEKEKYVIGSVPGEHDQCNTYDNTY